MINKYLTYQNKEIFYRIVGNGKPALFLHGFGEDGEVWKNQIEFLKDNPPPGDAGFKLIIPDLPGSGKSEMIDDMSMEGIAKLIHFIIHQENIDSLIIIGHSMGGYITLAFAEKYPKTFNTLKEKEDRWKAKWPWRSIGDYYIISFKKKSNQNTRDDN